MDRLIITSVGSSLLLESNVGVGADRVPYAARVRALGAAIGGGGTDFTPCFHTPTEAQLRLEDELYAMAAAVPSTRQPSAELATLFALPAPPTARDRVCLVVPETIAAIVCARVLRRIIEQRIGAAVDVRFIESFQLTDRLALERVGFPELVRTVASVILEHRAAPGREPAGGVHHHAAAAVVRPEDAPPVILAITAGLRPLSMYMTLTGLFFGAQLVYQPDRQGGDTFRLPSIAIQPDTTLWSRHRWLFDHVERHGWAARAMVLERLGGAWPAALDPYFLVDERTVVFSALGLLLDARAKAVHVDAVTRLPRRDFLEVVRPHLQRCESVGVVYLDIDHFKAINDTYAHAGGDQALREVAARAGAALAACAPEGYLLRWGGEEFLALLPGATADALGACARDVHAAIRSSPVTLDGTPVGVTVTVGADVWSPGDGTLEEAIRSADRRMYEGKSAGRDRVVLPGSATRSALTVGAAG